MKFLPQSDYVDEGFDRVCDRQKGVKESESKNINMFFFKKNKCCS